MAAIVSIAVGVVLELKHVVETNIIRASYCFITLYLNLNSHLNWLYIRNKTMSFSYDCGCGICEHCICIEAFTRRAGLGYR